MAIKGAPIQGLADRVSGIFVPTVVVTAALAFIGWLLWEPEPALIFAIASAVSVFIIACPCALGLATPISITTAAGRGAQLGVLIKDAEALELMAKMTTLIADKTVTLTEGRPQLTDVRSFGTESEESLLALPAALERGSEHPLAEAIVEGAKARGAAGVRSGMSRTPWWYLSQPGRLRPSTPVQRGPSPGRAWHRRY